MTGHPTTLEPASVAAIPAGAGSASLVKHVTDTKYAYSVRIHPKDERCEKCK